MSTNGQYGNELKDIKDILKNILKTLETNSSLNGIQTEVLTQMLRQLEITVCSLEHISKQTCESLNELHYQTSLQQSIQKSLVLLLDLYRKTHPGTQIPGDMIQKLERYIEESYAMQKPKPICEYQPCSGNPPTSEGTAKTSTTSADPHKVSGAQYPHIDIHGEEQERNEDTVPVVPIGPLRGPLAPSSKRMSLFQLTSDPDVAEARGGAGNPVIFDKDHPFGNRVGFSGSPPDMSGAMNRNLVFMTGNTFAAYSTDGNPFTALDPTTIFPSGPTRDAAGNLLDNGLCCDQVIQYVPSIDRFIWLMQFCGAGVTCIAGVNKIRIASASTQDIIDSGGTKWTYWDLASGIFNLGAINMDYPDMSVGTNFLYISTDSVGQGLLVMRISLSEIQNAGTINIGYTTPSDSSTAYGGHITQNTGNELYWAGHVNTSKLRVFNWPENSGQYSWRDVNTKSYFNSDYSSSCPDGTDWLGYLGNPTIQRFPGEGITGATRRFSRRLDGGIAGGPDSEVWFAWTAARGGAFPHPYIQVVQIDTNNWTVTNEWEIWNPDFAFAYPCLTTNFNQEVGISLGFGGGNINHPSHAVGLLGDFVVWYSELSDAAENRWGDYVTVRQASPNSKLYAAVGYSILKNAPPAAGTRYNPRYILFGRESDVKPPSPIR